MIMILILIEHAHVEYANYTMVVMLSGVGLHIVKR